MFSADALFAFTATAFLLIVVPGPRPRRRLFREGFVVGVTDPKNIVFFTAVLPQFVEESGAPVALQMTVLWAIYVGIALVADSVWGVIAGHGSFLVRAVTATTGTPRRNGRFGDDRSRTARRDQRAPRLASSQKRRPAAHGVCAWVSATVAGNAQPRAVCQLSA